MSSNVTNSSSAPADNAKPVLVDARRLSRHFPVRSGFLKKSSGAAVKAVDDVSFTIKSGETLGVVGESGCGKSTLGRILLRLDDPTSGEIHFEGENIVALPKNRLRVLRQDMQFIFQDPYSSMNPKMTIRDILLEPLDNFRSDMSFQQKVEYAEQLLETVGLPKDILQRYPHEFSGGQRQRIVIARGIALNPKLVVCDESVSALDVSVQAQVINLLMDLKRRLSLTYLFISHDLRVVRHVSDRIMVLYLGRIMEIAPADELFERPLHPYTRSLIGAISKGDPRKRDGRTILRGEIPSPINAPAGCPFSTRCPQVQERCRTERPALEAHGEGHSVSCFFV